jgi:hypothetical protein
MTLGKSKLRELALSARIVFLKSGPGKSREGANHDYFSTVFKPDF